MTLRSGKPSDGTGGRGRHPVAPKREFYVGPEQYLPNAAAADVVFIDAGHFWSMERPAEVTDAVRRLLAM